MFSLCEDILFKLIVLSHRLSVVANSIGLVRIKSMSKSSVIMTPDELYILLIIFSALLVLCSEQLRADIKTLCSNLMKFSGSVFLWSNYSPSRLCRFCMWLSFNSTMYLAVSEFLKINFFI